MGKILATNNLMCVLMPSRRGFRKECAFFFLDFMEIELDKMSIADDNTVTSLVGEPSGPRTWECVRAFLLRTPD